MQLGLKSAGSPFSIIAYNLFSGWLRRTLLAQWKKMKLSITYYIFDIPLFVKCQNLLF